MLYPMSFTAKTVDEVLAKAIAASQAAIKTAIKESECRSYLNREDLRDELKELIEAQHSHHQSDCPVPSSRGTGRRVNRPRQAPPHPAGWGGGG